MKSWFRALLVLPLMAGCGGGVKADKPSADSATPTLEQVSEPDPTPPAGQPAAPTPTQPTEGRPSFGELTDPKWSAPPKESSLPPLISLKDDFSSAPKSAERWFVTRKNDFAECLVGIVPDKAGAREGRLRLGCATRGTDDRTVKYLGIATRARARLKPSARLSFDLDWNDQANGCYLTGAMLLCPTLTTENPEDQPQWFKLEYVGVPPGKNARAAIWLKNGVNRLKPLHDEGWPKEQRTGRQIGRQHVELDIKDGRWAIRENGAVLSTSDATGVLPFDEAYVYLQMSSHSNYPRREIFFDNVWFEAQGEETEQQPKDGPAF